MKYNYYYTYGYENGLVVMSDDYLCNKAKSIYKEIKKWKLDISNEYDCLFVARVPLYKEGDYYEENWGDYQTIDCIKTKKGWK